MKNALIYIVFCVLSIYACSTPFVNKSHIITKIIDGNTIQLKSGVTVHLIGVSNTQQSYDYLRKNYVNKQVKIRYDSNKFYHVNSSNDKIYCYVLAGKNGNISLNAYLLKAGLAHLDETNLNDSLNVFENYISGQSIVHQSSSNKPINRQKDDFNSSSSRQPNSLKDLVREAEPNVFLIEVYDENKQQIKIGSGFVINPGNYGISNFHVIEDGTYFIARCTNGDEFEINDFIRIDENQDLVAFKLKQNRNRNGIRVSSYLPEKGEDIFVLGNPKGLESTLTKGIVSAIRSEIVPNDRIQIDAAISPGSSGGPVMNMNGEVFGVATFKALDCENCNFAVNIKLILNKLNN